MWFRMREQSWYLVGQARVIRRATEANVVCGVVPAPVAARGGPGERGRAPRAAAIHALFLGTWSRCVDPRIAALPAGRVDRVLERIEHPLGDVAAESSDPVRRAVLRAIVDVDRAAAERGAPTAGHAREDHAVAAGRVAAPRVRPAGRASRRILPLGLGRQALAPRRAVHPRAVPGDLDHGAVAIAVADAE